MKIKDLRVYKELNCEKRWATSNLVNRFKDSELIARYLQKEEGFFLVQGPRVMFGFHYFKVLDKRYRNKKKKHKVWHFFPMKRNEVGNKIRQAKEDGMRAILPKNVIDQICLEAI